MELAQMLIYNTLSSMLLVLEIALFLRAILSWFDPTGEGRFYVFLQMITEPLIYPVRVWFEKMDWFQGTPLDVPFFAVVLIVGILRFGLLFLGGGF